MKADEYDSLISDPTNYFISTYFPRIFGTLDAFKSISPMTNIMEMYGGFTGAALVSWACPRSRRPSRNSWKPAAKL